MGEKFSAPILAIQTMINEGASIEIIADAYNTSVKLLSDFISRNNIEKQHQIPMRPENNEAKRYLSSISESAKKVAHCKWGSEQ